MEGHLGLILDVLILLALGATIFHAQRLSRQFNRMQADREAFEKLIAALNAAADRAEAAIAAFKETAGVSGDRLQERINAARAISDELEIMVQAGDNLAERLQSLAEQGGKSAAAAGPRFGRMEDIEEDAGDEEPPREEPGEDRPRGTGLKPRTRAEKELLEALKAKQQS
ncbi:MAG: hypothetical protein GC185_02960 [Alphaproteobacteria bacterium]|nr:hypothetical protein [Alphaproteobacteria bacterium]